MRVCVQPRLQVENWSLYWKESMATDTQCLKPIVVELPDSTPAAAAAPDAPATAAAATAATAAALAPAAAATVADLLTAHAVAQGWPPATALVRLDGFGAPWERVLLRGRELQPQQSLAQLAAEAAAGKAAAGGGQLQGEERGAAGAAPEAGEGVDLTVMLVRVVLKADGWKIKQPGDFLESDSGEDDDDVAAAGP
ncbi:hypothetical protein HXX76_014614 [Chlamydomonas incerta]|uniref:Uncharacterized protein n=1 Tax=Chlamydomonas incerta TaxID=51695 RepID=A0A835VQV5_CHLIN|nr:hypothetical protein HXX76_014614 [Chlamydomonas incerta]|eukprot:KAG2424405.1 hypothetical protein HXX76_014614 [Chlamydomonas incerta]